MKSNEYPVFRGEASYTVRTDGQCYTYFIQKKLSYIKILWINFWQQFGLYKNYFKITEDIYEIRLGKILYGTTTEDDTDGLTIDQVEAMWENSKIE